MTAPATLDLTPTWAGLLPALVACLQNGTGEGPAIAQAELARLCAFADSAIAEQKAAKARPPVYTEELAARRGRGLAASDLGNAARDFMTQGAFMRAACYWEAAARVAPADMEAARDFRVSADLAEREAAALLSSHAAAMRKEGREGAAQELPALADLDAMRAAIAAALDAARPPHRGVQSFAAIRRALEDVPPAAPLAEALAMARSALAAFPPADLERQKGGAAWRDTSKDLRAALAELVAAFSSSPSSN